MEFPNGEETEKNEGIVEYLLNGILERIFQKKNSEAIPIVNLEESVDIVELIR